MNIDDKDSAQRRMGKSSSVAAAQVLREDILKLEPGSFLGSADDLMRRLSVGRATFRQTAQVLIHQGLLEVRRGPGGGYYSRSPDLSSVVDATVLFLRAKDTTLKQTTWAAHFFSIGLARWAATSDPGRSKEEFRRFVASFRDIPAEDCSVMEFVVDEMRLNDAIFTLIDNPALHLIVNILYHYALDERRNTLFQRHPQRRVDWRRLRIKQAEAIADGNVDAATKLAHELTNLSTSWLETRSDS